MNDTNQESSRLSVVMATYNGEAYIRQQLDSILTQTVLPDEIVIVDDCSGDGTVEVLQAYAEQHDIIQLHRNEQNLGVNKNFEKACTLSRGDYILFSDQDDIWLPEKIETMMPALRPGYLTYSDAAIVDAEGETLRESEFKYHGVTPLAGQPIIALSQRNCVSGHNIAVSREIVESALPFADGIFYDQWLALVACTHNGIRIVADKLVKHRMHVSNANNNLALPKKKKLGLWDKLLRVSKRQSLTRRNQIWLDVYSRLLELPLPERAKVYFTASKQHGLRYDQCFFDKEYFVLLKDYEEDVFSVSILSEQKRKRRLKHMAKGRLAQAFS